MRVLVPIAVALTVHGCATRRAEPTKDARPAELVAPPSAEPAPDAAPLDAGPATLAPARLPDLSWRWAGPYATAREETLTGADPKACTELPTVATATPSTLWAAAQCERLRGEPLDAVLRRVEARCIGLAKQALPLVKRLALLQDPDGTATSAEQVEEARSKLEAVDPPTACFAEDPNWDVAYTARLRPLEVPKAASLAPAWRALETIQPAKPRP